jgi:hypothetical protein
MSKTATTTTTTPRVRVAANYVDRYEPEYRWLAYDPANPPVFKSETLEVRHQALVCKGVRFQFTNERDGERGFGCRVVANCASAEPRNATDEELASCRPIRFAYDRFCWQDTQSEVQSLSLMVLDDEGNIFGRS